VGHGRFGHGWWRWVFRVKLEHCADQPLGRGKLSDVEHKVTVSAFCRRRLPVVMTRLKMADHVTAAIKFIEQGHVRVGTDVITDTAYLVTR
jgi:U3 small nucleolar ribonucleoprotein protein IMP3